MKTTLLAFIVFFAALLLSWAAHVFQPSLASISAHGSRKLEKTATGSRQVNVALSGAAVKHPSEVWQEYSRPGGRLTTENIKQIADDWVARDAREAAEFGMALTDTFQRGAFLRRVLTEWAKEDFRGFHVWLLAKSPDLRLASLLDLTSIGYNMRQPSLAAIEQLIALAPPSSALPDCIGHLAVKVWTDAAQRDSLHAWASTLADGTLRDAVWNQIAVKMAEDDPRAAAAMLPAITDLRRSRDASSTIAAHLALTHPAQAMEYAASLADPLASEAAWKSAFATWSQRDPATSLAHVRDAAADFPLVWLDAASYGWGKTMPVEAVRSIMVLPESRGDRESLVSSIMQAWNNENPAEAARWLSGEQAASLLPANTRQTLREKLLPPMTTGTRTSSTTVNDRRVTYIY